jgi:hypothetical protein
VRLENSLQRPMPIVIPAGETIGRKTVRPRAGRTAPTLATLLELLRPHVPEALVPTSAHGTALRAAAMLPPAAVTAFECRLNGDRTKVDLAIAIIPSTGVSELLAGVHPAYGVAAKLAADPLWRRVMRLCRIWSDGGLLRPSLDLMYVEMDQADLSHVPLPSILFCEVIAAAQQRPELQANAMLDVFLPLARERALSLPQRDCILRTLATMRPFGQLYQFGSALTRPDSAVRLVFGLPRERLWASLVALGFAHRAGPIMEAVEAVGHSLGHILLHVDAGESLGPRIGIDLPGAPLTAWKAVIRGLVERGLCGLDQAVALAEWSHFPPEIGLWRDQSACRLPDDPARLSEAVTWRKINHGKLAFTPDGAIEAKAYLLAGFMWRPTS